MNILIIYFGKFLSFLSNKLNFGSGLTWPGHIALILNEDFIFEILKKSKTKIILVTGTNGKTTTTKLIQTILENAGKEVFLNKSGANLLNGIASSLIQEANILGKINADYAVFEVDENTFPLVVQNILPKYVIALNLFRDQLDRYGEVDSIARNWRKAYEKLKTTTFILNADDPQIAYLAKATAKKPIFFGLKKKQSEKVIRQSADSIFCPKCGSNLNFRKTYFSHLGDWKCEKCKTQRPKPNLSSLPYYPLKGTYNQYNTLAAVLLTRKIGIDEKTIEKALKKFKPAFGRQEVIEKNGKKVKIFLSKNPTSFNESLRTISNAKTLLIVLNDRIPDGTDVSWIWDIDTEGLLKSKNVIVSGDRAYDMGLRLKYSRGNKNSKTKIFRNLNAAVREALDETPQKDTLYVLPTYSAMLEVRKILTGRGIL